MSVEAGTALIDCAHAYMKNDGVLHCWDKHLLILTLLLVLLIHFTPLFTKERVLYTLLKLNNLCALEYPLSIYIVLLHPISDFTQFSNFANIYAYIS